jgi:acetyl esterase/lipase
MKHITHLLLFLTTTVLAEPGSISYPPLPAQVSYQAVTTLPARAPDQRISYGSDPLQHGLLWLPSTDQAKQLVVLVHGGCWLNAFGVDHTQAMATALSQAGHPVWSLEYRRSGDAGGGWPGSLNDIKSALQQLHLLEEHGITTEQVTIMGHSAGGHLALLAASELPDINWQQIIGLAAITDVSRYALGSNSCQQATTQFMAGLPHERPDAYQQANLIYRSLPEQVLLLQGDADRIVPELQSRLHAVQAEVLPGAGHFDWIHPGSPAFTRLLEHLSNE